jgi:hypothetical protein
MRASGPQFIRARLCLLHTFQESIEDLSFETALDLYQMQGLLLLRVSLLQDELLQIQDHLWWYALARSRKRFS